MSEFSNSTILVTGGTGSFGKAFVRKFLNESVGELRVFSRDEKKQDDMRKEFPYENLRFIIGDVRDRDAVLDAMRGVDFVFHAAALKQVPSCEFYPIEALKTNVLGTENVLEAASRNLVKRVVCLSTDKAVYPINAMGITKSLMEKVVSAKSRQVDPEKTLYCCTRYGNVVGSRGSVIPLFLDQLSSGDRLTLTDPRMTRFIMTLEEAIDLVTYAFNHGSTGDLFVQKSPATSIGTIAEALKELTGKPNFPIQIIGTRHGEKLFETLLSREEMAIAEDLGGYYRVRQDGRDLNYSKYVQEGMLEISESNDYNSENTRQLTKPELMDLLSSQFGDFFEKYGN